MLDASTNTDDLTKAVANSVKVNSGACPQKGGAGSETGGARGPTRSDLDLSGHVKEEVPDVKPLPDSGDNDHSATPLYVESSSEEEAVMPLSEPGEGMEEPERPDAAQAARPTAGAEKDAAQKGEGGGEEAEAGGEAEGEGGDPKPRAEAAEAEKQCAQAQTGLPAAPSPAPSGFDTPQCVPPGKGYHVPEHLKQLVLQAQCSVSLH